MSSVEATEHTILQRHMIRGSIWTVGLRWSLRLTGLVNIIILARLLTPADFGIVAIATMIVGLVEIFAQTGQTAALIRHPNPTRDHYDSAWTVSVLLGLGLGALIFVLTPITTAYFHEPRAHLVVEVLALRTIISGAQNVAVLNFRRNLQFDKQFWFSVIPSLVALVVTVGAAIVLRNYWALVIGLMAEQVAEFVLSYAMEPYRPRFCVSKVGEIWSFSAWTLFQNIGFFFNSLVDRVAIGGFAGSDAMGRYYVATDVAISPSQELVGPVTTALFPVMAKVQDDREKRRRLYMTVLYWSALICSSTAVGVALVSDDIVDLVLGPQWQDVKPLMPWLALSYGVLGLSSSVYTALDTIGQPVVSARLQWVRLAALSLAVFPVAQYFHDLEAVAMTRLVVTILITPTLFLALMQPFDLKLWDIVSILWRPMTAGLFMALVVLGLNSVVPFEGNLRLVIDMVCGASAYGAALMVLWFLSGQPEGPESEVWRRVGPLLNPAQQSL